MKLNETIKYFEEKACSNNEYTNEYKQLAEWLKELQRLKTHPSNFDWSEEKYAYTNGEDNDYHEGASEGLPFDPIVHTEKTFNAGVEWMAEQGTKDIWHNVDECDLPKEGKKICLIHNERIISGEFRKNKFYGKVCNGYDNSVEKGDKWCYLANFLFAYIRTEKYEQNK